jgi:peptide/nickel transport system substrate-binding protein
MAMGPKLRRVLLLIVVSCLLLASCSSPATPETALETDEAAPATQQPEPAEQTTGPSIAVYAVAYTPVTDWDPHAEFATGIIVLQNVYETLLRYEPETDSLTPILATSYSHSEDGLVWTFQIREGVKFHDGTTMDAEAVRFSIQRCIDLGKGGSYILAPIESIEVTGEYEVQFKLKYPAPLDLVMASGLTTFIVSPAAVNGHEADWFTKGNEAGTGPYKLKSYRLNEEVVLERFEDYWRGWDGDHIDVAVIRNVPESATRRQLLEKGDADVVGELPPEDLDALQSNPSLKAVPQPSWEHLMAWFNTQRAPLDNQLVRQALSYAFPYKQAVENAFGGYAEQSRGFVTRSIWGHSDDIFQYQLDLDKAKELLTEAGYPDGGFTLELHYTSGYEQVKRVAELYKAELAKLGVELDIRGMPLDSWWEVAKSPDPAQRQDIVLTWNWVDYATPYSYLYTEYHSSDVIVWNFSYLSNPELDALLDEADATSAVDRAKAAEMFVDAQDMLIDIAPSIPILDRQYTPVIAASLENFKMNPCYPRVVRFYDLSRAQ